MARLGVTQEQVNAAADALLQAGERPTIERVRHALGTGSPNTLIRLLDVWWTALGTRLSDRERKVALPDAPSSVAEAANTFWALALEQATSWSEVQLASERAVLSQAQAQLSTEIAASAAIADQAKRDVQRAQESQRMAEMRLGDIQRLVDAQQLQLSELQSRREAGIVELGLATRRAELAEEKLIAQVVATDAQREALEAQHHMSEGRWMQEVDRARQATLKTLGKLKQAESEAATKATQVAETMRVMQTALTDAERAQIANRATISALETEVARMHDQLAGNRGRKSLMPRKRSSVRIKR